MSQRRITQYDSSDLYGHNVDITEGNPVNDPRVVQYRREIKQLKEKIELSTELNRQLERDKNSLQSQLDSYKKRCSDLQQNLDDKDQHLNEVVASLTVQHSKQIPVKKKKERSGWFGFGTPKSNKLSSHSHTHTPSFDTPSATITTHSPMGSPITDLNEEYMQSPIDSNMNIYATAPMGIQRQRHASVHIMGDGSAEDSRVYIGTGTSSLIGMDRNEMEFKIKNCSKDKLRNYIQDLHSKYGIIDKEKSQLFHDLVKATHNQGWTEKQAMNKDKEAKSAIEKEKYAKNHIKMLEKSLTKERKKIEKYRISFEDFKNAAIKKRKDLILSDKKLKDIISMKDEFIQRACYKLILYKDRLAQFEVPVFQEYLILISPNINILLRYDGEGMNGPGARDNLSSLHQDMVHKQTPGGPGFINEDGNSPGGTVTSIASVTSTQSNGGRRKSSSRKSSVASASADGGDIVCNVGDINDKSQNEKPKRKRRKRKKEKLSRVKSCDDAQSNNNNEFDGDEKDSINIPITAKSKSKKRKKLKRRSSVNAKTESLSTLSKKIDKKKSEEKRRKKEENRRRKAAERKEKMKDMTEEDYLEFDLDDMVSSSSSSSESEEAFMLLSDSGENIHNHTILEYALDENGKYRENTDGITNNLSNYVELKLVKYPGTGELYMVVTKFDDKKDAMEVFRSDFAKCLNIEKSQIEEDFSVYFEHITLVFRADDYEKTRSVLLTLRMFFEQHCTNIQPELPPPPEQTVTDQMNLFFGGGF